jgi:hypothetical protein
MLVVISCVHFSFSLFLFSSIDLFDNSSAIDQQPMLGHSFALYIDQTSMQICSDDDDASEGERERFFLSNKKKRKRKKEKK